MKSAGIDLTDEESSKDKRAEDLTEQQRLYVSSHLSCGHAGHCFAWLDTAFCPQAFLMGQCSFIHDQPKSWTDSQKEHHVLKLAFVKDLWQDADPLEALSYLPVKSDSVVLRQLCGSTKKRCSVELFPFLSPDPDLAVSKRRLVLKVVAPKNRVLARPLPFNVISDDESGDTV